MSAVAKYGVILGALVGVIAAIAGVLLFHAFYSYNMVFFTFTAAFVAVIFALPFLIVAILLLIFGGGTQQLELWGTIISSIMTLVAFRFFEGLDYSLKISTYNPYFALLLVASGILMAVGFFSKYSEDRNSLQLLGGVFALVGIAAGAVALCLGLQPVSYYTLGLLDVSLVFSANANFLYLNIGTLLLFSGFFVFGIIHLRTRYDAEKPGLCTGIGILEIITGVIMLGGIINAAMLIAGFALMIITLILWIPHASAEYN
ncbi:MAG: hypothetical protein ACTSV0_08850 [Candidatus Freyarchaeota archaeon]